MAARRLVIVMLMLLGVSTLAAALAPTPGGQTGSTSSTTTTAPAAPLTQAGGELVRATIDAEASKQRVPIALGDQLSLRVRSRRVTAVEIPRLGLTRNAAPLSPARFDVFADREGRFELRQQDSRRAIGLIVVRAR